MFFYFLKREIKESYLGNIAGLSWVLIQPVILLLIYSLVFEKILNARFPEAEHIGFTVYLAIGFWPWLAFSESVSRSITSITEKEDLIGKVSLNSIEIVQATITSSFILQVIGYIFILFILIIIGKDIKIFKLPLLIIPILQLYFLALALGYFLASLQVFIKDIKNIFNTLITLWFFSTPIIYSKSIIPEEYQDLFRWNIIYHPISFIHDLLITNNNLAWLDMAIVSAIILLLYIIGFRFYKKLEPSFDEYI